MIDPSKRRNTAIATKIPDEFALEVGHLVTQWAGFEFRVQYLIWLIMGVSAEVGRAAIREPPRIAERIALLIELAEIKEIKTEPAVLKKVTEIATYVETQRDMFSHCTWAKDEGDWFILYTRGKHTDQSANPRSRRRTPEGLKVTKSEILEVLSQFDALVGLMIELTEGYRKNGALLGIPR